MSQTRPDSAGDAGQLAVRCSRRQARGSEKAGFLSSTLYHNRPHAAALVLGGGATSFDSFNLWTRPVAQECVIRTHCSFPAARLLSLRKMRAR